MLRLGMPTRYLLPALVALTACSASPPAMASANDPPPVWIDARFSQEDRKAIAAALNVWHEAVEQGFGPMRLCNHGADCAKHAGSGAFVFQNMREDEQAVIELPPSVLGWVEDICDRQVHLIPTRIHSHSIDLEDVTLHEVGHALCLQHQPVDSLMFPSIGPGEGQHCVDYTTLLQYLIAHPDATVHLTCTTERKNAGLELTL